MTQLAASFPEVGEVVPADLTAAFLVELFGSDCPGFLSVHHPAPGDGDSRPPLRTWWRPATELNAVAADVAGLSAEHDTWISMCPRASRLGPGKRGGNADVIALPGLWSDIDIAHPVHKKSDSLPPTIDAAMELVDAIGLPPSVVIDSGHGLYPMWFFTKPWVFASDDDRSAAIGLANRWKATIAHHAEARGWKVDAVADLARILRPPGSFNRKDPDDVRPVTILRFEEGLRYTADDFEAHVIDLPAETKKVVSVPATRTPPALPDDAALVAKAKAAANGTAFSSLWAGSTAGHGDDPSAADLALCNMLRFWTNGDTGRIDRLFRQSGLMRPKWDEQHAADGRTYGAMTIAKAKAGANGDGYTGRRPIDGRTGSSAAEVADPPDEQPVPAMPAFPCPIPLDNPKPPALPDDIFDGWLGDFIDAVSLANETPPELAAAFALAAVSAVCQRRFRVRIEQGVFEPVNVWPLCALPPGNRKTAVMLAAAAPLARWEEQKAAELAPLIEQAKSERKTLEARITRLRGDASKANGENFDRLKAELAELEGELPEVPSAPQLFAQDVTPEHTGTMLSDNGERLAIFSDEAGVFDVMAGRYSNGVPNLDVYLQSHAGSFVRVNRGSRPAVNLKHPALTIGISPQPDVLRGLTANKGFRGRGLLARFLYFVPPSRLGYRTGKTVPLPEHVVAAYQGAVMALADVPAGRDGDREIPHVLSLSPEALSLWRNFWHEVEVMMRDGGRLEHVTDWGGKLPGAVARVAGLLHCAAYTSCVTEVRTIEADTMGRAVRLGRFLIEHALVAFDAMGADAAMEAARDLWKAVEKNRQPRFTARDAWHPLRSKYKRMDAAEPGFDVLIDHGYVAEPHQADDGTPRKRGRPPSRMFLVNPALTEGW